MPIFPRRLAPPGHTAYLGVIQLKYARQEGLSVLRKNGSHGLELVAAGRSTLHETHQISLITESVLESPQNDAISRRVDRLVTWYPGEFYTELPRELPADEKLWNDNWPGKLDALAGG